MAEINIIQISRLASRFSNNRYPKNTNVELLKKRVCADVHKLGLLGMCGTGKEMNKSVYGEELVLPDLDLSIEKFGNLRRYERNMFGLGNIKG